MATATLTSKGQITLPKEVREHLHLGEGDRLEFVIRSDGEVHVQPVAGSYRDLRGMVRRPGKLSPSDEALDQEMTRLLAEDDERIRRGGL
ncbi:MAG TPA: type II toxin-antitoxin system PrlF family antitoxin [Thermoanaerobaculia bacterium]|nr:type II toxin-antitoxin system PrlF family antitoxin [Thermoanaerobaculia bacterium]